MIKPIVAFLSAILFCLNIGVSAALSDEQPVPITKTQNEQSNRVVGYFTSWSIYARNCLVTDIDPSLLTHINYAFANLSPEGEILVGDSWADLEKTFPNQYGPGNYNQLQGLKEKNPNLKILISVGGWTWSSNFSAVAQSEAGRKRFADSAVRFLTKYKFDGLDVDWEYPVEGGNGIPHSPADKQNYILLVKEIRDAFDKQQAKDGKQYLLTIAAGANSNFLKNTDIVAMLPYLDFINIMTYDYHGSWDSATNHNAPLASSKDAFSIANTIEQYLATGIDASKLNLGLAFYGRGWTNVSAGQSNGLNQPASACNGTGIGQGTWEAGVFDYWDLKENYVNKNGYSRYFDPIAQSPYLYNGTQFISYDDEESIAKKVSFANEKGLGGVMFWEFSGDKNKELQTVIKKTSTGKTNVSTTPIVKPTENQPQDSSILPWQQQTVYTAGNQVSFQGKVYQAKWWTQNEMPDATIEWGPWKQIN